MFIGASYRGRPYPVTCYIDSLVCCIGAGVDIHTPAVYSDGIGGKGDGGVGSNPHNHGLNARLRSADNDRRAVSIGFYFTLKRDDYQASTIAAHLVKHKKGWRIPR